MQFIYFYYYLKLAPKSSLGGDSGARVWRVEGWALSSEWVEGLEVRISCSQPCTPKADSKQPLCSAPGTKGKDSLKLSLMLLGGYFPGQSLIIMGLSFRSWNRGSSTPHPLFGEPVGWVSQQVRAVRGHLGCSCHCSCHRPIRSAPKFENRRTASKVHVGGEGPAPSKAPRGFLGLRVQKCRGGVTQEPRPVLREEGRKSTASLGFAEYSMPTSRGNTSNKPQSSETARAERGERAVKKRKRPLCGQKRKSLFQTVSWAVTQRKQRGATGGIDLEDYKEKGYLERRWASELVEEMRVLGNMSGAWESLEAIVDFDVLIGSTGGY